jgi:DNA-binding beta-propeller fold protein YncE
MPSFTFAPNSSNFNSLVQIPDGQAALRQIGTFKEPNGAGSEISAFDPATKRLFVVSGGSVLQVLDISNPSNPKLVGEINITQIDATLGAANSVAVKNGIVAIAVEANPKTSPGQVLFFNAEGTFQHRVTVGALPDMLTFTPDGKSILVANEGEPNSYNQPNSINPEGSISIINLSNGVANATVRTADFQKFNDRISELQSQGIRITGPNATVAQDLEPEFITVSPDGKTAWVTLQENNALAVVDIASASVTKLIPLGLKDFSGIGIDPSDRDGGINIRTGLPIFGIYQPDAIASYAASNGQTYLVMANEGDGRSSDDYPGFNEITRLGDPSYVLDPAKFPNAADLKQNANLGRLNVSRVTGDTDGDGDIDRIEMFGARSFSIRDIHGHLIFDSGDQLERLTAAAVPAIFNSNGTAATFDQRSDDKGSEPEGIAIGQVDDRSYAFIGLERTSGIVVYDITNVNRPRFVEYVSVPTDFGPEGLAFISAALSPTGKALLSVTNEISKTTSIFEFNAPVPNGAGGQKTFEIYRGDGKVTIQNFGGVGRGDHPSDSTIAEVDTLKFLGANFTARNLQLTQAGADTIISFEAEANDATVVLKNFQLDQLDNLRRSTGASINIDNILFEGQSSVQESFDVFDANFTAFEIFNRNTVTFLNELDNITRGFDDSNDVINAQGGDDMIAGLSGNDLLRGGSGHDRLFGGSGNDSLFGGSGYDILFGGEGNDFLDGGTGFDRLWGGKGRDTFVLRRNSGTDTIEDFDDKDDRIGLADGLRYGDLTIASGSGKSTVISVTHTQEVLAIVLDTKPKDFSRSTFTLV